MIDVIVMAEVAFAEAAVAAEIGLAAENGAGTMTVPLHVHVTPSAGAEMAVAGVTVVSAGAGVD